MISGDDPRDAVVGSARPPEREAASAVVHPDASSPPDARSGSSAPLPPPFPLPPSAAAPQSSPTSMICPSCSGEYGPEVRFCPRDGAVLRAKARSGDLSGQIVGGRYRVHRQLGAGGMGTVYLAEHVRMGRPCALKVLSRALSEEVDATSRFAREAANASRVAHPNVATVYDFGETEEGLVYLAMEYVEGEPLSRLMKREGRLPAERAVDIACQIAAGLAAAHRAGLVHRDLKPDNVLVSVDEDGADRVKVIDFGIAKAAQDAGQDLTRTGFVLGTPRYMSPEQLMGEQADGRSDLYALGCILFEMLIGDDPWGGATPAGVTRRLTEATPHPRTIDARIPAALDAAIVRLLSRAREERFQSAEETSRALAQAVGAGPAARAGASEARPAGAARTPGAARGPDRHEAGAGAPPAVERRAAPAEPPLLPLPAPDARTRGARAPLLVATLLALVATGGGIAFVYFGVLSGGRSGRAAAGDAADAAGSVPAAATPAGAAAAPGGTPPRPAGASRGAAPSPPASAAGSAGGRTADAGSAGDAAGRPGSGSSTPALSSAAPAPGATAGKAAASAATPADAGVAPTIEPLIGRFVRALESRDLDRIKRIDAEADGTDRWWKFISGPDVAELRTESRILSGPDVQGDEGSAIVEVTFRYRSGEADAARPWPMRITFGRDADGWRIRTVRTLQ